MAAFLSLLAVTALIALSAFGAGAGMANVFGIYVPYAAVTIFIVGFVSKVIGWAATPVPFNIPTTGGQQYGLPWVKHQKFDNPKTGFQTVVRMLLEVLCFRSLFRNFYLDNRYKDGRVGYGPAKGLWFFALLFHWTFLIVVIRHLRFFLEPVPTAVTGIEFVDNILQIGVPTLYLTDVTFLAALAFLLGRRFWDRKVRYISLINDYFPLLLLIGIGLTGIYMRYFVKVDVIAVKQLAMGLVTFHPEIPKNVDPAFYAHFFLVCVLWAYFPFSKLMHAPGIFFSPTRNVPNDTRMVHHVNPWNDPSVKPHSYEHYEDEYREKMIEAEIPVDKQA
ncbi:sulfate reduction electron transfer complex DsrMKJOP subunit DsrM [Fundidesulfovibrio butyratiphilus]